MWSFPQFLILMCKSSRCTEQLQHLQSSYREIHHFDPVPQPVYLQNITLPKFHHISINLKFKIDNITQAIPKNVLLLIFNRPDMIITLNIFCLISQSDIIILGID